MANNQGHNANENGANFEELINKIMSHKIKKNYQIRNEELNKSQTNIVYREFWKNDKLYCVYCKQEGFEHNFLPKYDITSGSNKEPDGFFYYPDKNLAIILEIKKQGSPGSVKEKLGNSTFLRDYQYKRILKGLNCKIDMVYALDEWFRLNLEEDYFNNWDDHKIAYHFGIDFPLVLVGLEESVKTSPEEIKKIKDDLETDYDEPIVELF